jgi:RNA polymerase sigma-70 factor (ECF subfamily)
VEEDTITNWPEVVEEHYRSIYAFAFQFTGKRADAEDICQQTFLKALEKIDSVSDRTKIRSWLYTIARNNCIDRTRWYKKIIFKQTLEDQSVTYKADVLLSEHLLRAIQTLPRQQRAVFLLRVLHEFSTTETAETLSISTGTVKSHLARALKGLRKDLKPFWSEMTTNRPAHSSQVIEGEKV